MAVPARLSISGCQCKALAWHQISRRPGTAAKVESSGCLVQDPTNLIPTSPQLLGHRTSRLGTDHPISILLHTPALLWSSLSLSTLLAFQLPPQSSLLFIFLPSDKPWPLFIREPTILHLALARFSPPTLLTLSLHHPLLLLHPPLLCPAPITSFFLFSSLARGVVCSRSTLFSVLLVLTRGRFLLLIPSRL